MKKKELFARLSAAAVSAAVMLTVSGCASQDKKTKSNTESKSDSATESTSESVVDGKKVEVYLAEDGTPYYLNEDGEKMMLFATPFADESDDGADDSNYDVSEQFIRGHYSANGLEFTIPDGWFAEDSLGAPTIFQDFEQGEEINYDEAISIVPTSYIFDSIENGEADEDAVESYFSELTEAGFYSSYELLGSGSVNVCGVDAKYFDIKASMPMDTESEDVFRTRYIVTPGDNSHCLILSSLDTEESAKLVQDVFDSFSDTIKFPTAEQMKNTEAELEAEESEDLEEDEEEAALTEITESE